MFIYQISFISNVDLTRRPPVTISFYLVCRNIGCPSKDRQRHKGYTSIEHNICYFMILDGSKTSLERCLHVLKLHADTSGLCINVDKTKVIWIGSEKNSEQAFCEDLNLCWDNSEFNELGVQFTKKLREVTEMNYLPKIEEMKKLFLNWSKRILTPIGKSTVIKSLALFKINHLILSLPKPSEKIITHAPPPQKLCFIITSGMVDQTKLKDQ